jgi:hypothetical protein
MLGFWFVLANSFLLYQSCALARLQKKYANGFVSLPKKTLVPRLLEKRYKGLTKK